MLGNILNFALLHCALLHCLMMNPALQNTSLFFGYIIQRSNPAFPNSFDDVKNGSNTSDLI